MQQAFDDARRALAAGQALQAERGFRALAQTNPELGGPHANLGLIHRQSGKLSEAVPELEAAVRASPQQPAYLNQLGIAYRQQGRFDKAREAYEEAIALAPGYAAPQLNLAILYDLYLGDGKRALEQYERYLALTPGGDATVTKWVVDLTQPQAAGAGVEPQGQGMKSRTATPRLALAVFAAALCAAPACAQDRADIDRTQIIGNRELPKVLYIVPWKKPLPGDAVGAARSSACSTKRWRRSTATCFAARCATTR